MYNFSKYLIMSKKIYCRTIIFSNPIYDEIKLLQKELTNKDGKTWSISSTVNLLLRFYLCEENDLFYAQNVSFLRDFMQGKELFLEEFISRILISTY